MVNQVTINLITTKGQWNTTFQKSSRVKDVILGTRMHFRLPKDVKFIIYNQSSPEIEFDPDRALVNYNVKDGDTLILKESKGA